MREKVIYTIETHNMINRGEGIVVGLSGGPDSVSMIHLLNSIKYLYDAKLYAVHLNHMLRGEESLRDEEYAKNFAAFLGVPFFSRRVDVEKFAQKNRMSCEEAGRFLRYSFFEEVCKETGAKKIALAHNMNDQAETALMHFLRGSGLSGIGGIRPVRDGKYIRPLLYCSRQEIEKYCEDNNLNPVIDSTNRQDIYSRNKIRLEMIPYIQKNFNSNIIESLSKASELARDEDEYLNSRAHIELEKIRLGKGICIKEFNLLHITMRRRIIRALVETIKGSLEGIESKHIEDCITLIARGRTGKSINLPYGIKCEIEYDIFKITVNDFIEDFEYSLEVPGKTEIPEANSIVYTRIIENWTKEFNESGFIKYFDYDKIKNVLKIRNRRDGDYIYPRGMEGRKKLKEFYIDKKVPKEERQKAVLLAAGSEVLWIVGMRDTRKYKTDANTRIILEVRIERGAEDE